MGTAREWYTEHGLAFPPLPATLEQQLGPRGDTMWATEGALEPLWDTKQLATEASIDFPAPQAAIGATGRGMASNALYCTIVTDGVALFLEHGWGNVGDDDNQVAADIGSDYAIAALILDTCAAHPHDPDLVILKSTLRLDARIFQDGTWTDYHTYDVLHRALEVVGNVT